MISSVIAAGCLVFRGSTTSTCSPQMTMQVPLLGCPVILHRYKGVELERFYCTVICVCVVCMCVLHLFACTYVCCKQCYICKCMLYPTNETQDTGSAGDINVSNVALRHVVIVPVAMVTTLCSIFSPPASMAGSVSFNFNVSCCHGDDITIYNV